LRSDVQLWAACDVPSVFLGNESGESVSHKPMLSDVHEPSKDLQQASFSNHEPLVTRTHG
jgi:hypothetical protein